MVLGLTNEGGKYRHVSGASWHCFGGDCDGQLTRREICRLVVRPIKITAWVDLWFKGIHINLCKYFYLFLHKNSLFFLFYTLIFQNISHQIIYITLHFIKILSFYQFFFFFQNHISLSFQTKTTTSLYFSLSLKSLSSSFPKASLSSTPSLFFLSKSNAFSLSLPSQKSLIPFQTQGSLCPPPQGSQLVSSSFPNPRISLSLHNQPTHCINLHKPVNDSRFSHAPTSLRNHCSHS